MRIQKLGNRVSVQTPAKVNLFLDVLGRRDDGYHEIETLMCPIDLCDTLTAKLSDEPEVSLTVSTPETGRTATPSAAVRLGEVDFNDSATWDIPQDSRNLAFRALAQIRQELGERRGIQLALSKRIPAAAGLGGGSSDAAAAIVAGQLAYGRWDRELAVRVAKSIGSDVAFFLGNNSHFGLATATGRGENCVVLDVEPTLNFILTHPPKGCSTASIYQHFSSANLRRVKRPCSLQEFTEYCAEGDPRKIGAGMFNALQSSAVALNEWIEIQLDLLLRGGAQHVLMSGSGSSCFGVVDDQETGERIHREAESLGITRVYSTRSIYSPSIEQQIAQWSDAD